MEQRHNAEGGTRSPVPQHDGFIDSEDDSDDLPQTLNTTTLTSPFQRIPPFLTFMPTDDGLPLQGHHDRRKAKKEALPATSLQETIRAWGVTPQEPRAHDAVAAAMKERDKYQKTYDRFVAECERWKGSIANWKRKLGPLEEARRMKEQLLHEYAALEMELEGLVKEQVRML